MNASARPAAEPAIVRPRLTMPPSAVVLLLAIIASGSAAARFALPLLWVVTPLVAIVILAAAVRRDWAGTADDLDAAQLPASLRRIVRHASATLAPGEPRQLLASVVRQARAIATESAALGKGAGVSDDVAGLLDACCTTALELARLDASFSPSARVADAPSAPRDELDARYRAARQLFVRRLGDAELVLRTLYTAGVEHGTPASDRVAELVTEIRADANARRAANDELQRLLGVTS